MNTNSNVYTVIYTTIIVVIVAAVLAFVAMKLGPAQKSNEKAETLRQMMTAAKVRTAEEIYSLSNKDVLKLYSENAECAFTIDLNGEKNGELATAESEIQLIDNFKPTDKAIAAGEATLPVYVFKGGVTVVPVYGAGLWGPIWGYIAMEPDAKTIKGAYFDHASETPGLGAKIKDDPTFREKFTGKTVEFERPAVFSLEKNAESLGEPNAVDAISGATMTSRGLNAAINTWMGAYRKYFEKSAFCNKECCCDGSCGTCALEEDADYAGNTKAEEE